MGAAPEPDAADGAAAAKAAGRAGAGFQPPAAAATDPIAATAETAEIATTATTAATDAAAPDFAALYDGHADYVARRAAGSFEQAQIELEVSLFKVPNLLRVWPDAAHSRSVLEIGCATGELIDALPAGPRARKVGIDISAANIAAGRARFPDIEFHCGDFRALHAQRFDTVVMSDVLEHIPDDAAFLRDAAALGGVVLVNLPLEDNWLNRWRRYGADDVSGHLRRYSLTDGLALIERAGLDVIAQTQVWVHETPTEAARRALRRERLGAAFAGAWPARALRHAVFALATAVRPLGRRLFASNLFVAARARSGAASAIAHDGPAAWLLPVCRSAHSAGGAGG